MKDDPINNIEWIDCEDLEANDYNPNVVYTPELKSLERNILTYGWIQPVICSKDGIIIDGFHRTMLTRESKKLREKYKGKLPCVKFDISRDEAMILTVRMNRAKGSHVALRMSAMVKELIDKHKWSNKDLAKEFGAPLAEIDLLYQDGVFKQRDIKNYKYSKAWYPQLKESETNED